MESKSLDFFGRAGFYSIITNDNNKHDDDDNDGIIYV